MDSRVNYLSELIYKEINNVDLVAKGQRAIKVSGFIIFIFWCVGISFFIFTSSYMNKNQLEYVILMCFGGVFIIAGLIIPLLWIISINLKIKKYYLNVFNQQKNKLFKLSLHVFHDIKIFEKQDNTLEIEKDNRKYHLQTNKLLLSTKFKLSKGKSYYLTISKFISDQIAEYIITEIENLWKK